MRRHGYQPEPGPRPDPPVTGSGVVTSTVADVSDAELVRRAVTSARDRNCWKGQKHARWTAVMDAFALGSTFSQQLCLRFNLDPDEMVKR